MGYYDKRVVYLSEMEQGNRIKGAGFVRMECQGESCSFDMHVSGMGMLADRKYDIYAVSVWGKERLLGQIYLHGGNGEWKEAYDKARMGMAYEEVSKILVKISATKLLAGKTPFQEKTVQAAEIGAADAAGREGTAGESARENKGIWKFVRGGRGQAAEEGSGIGEGPGKGLAEGIMPFLAPGSREDAAAPLRMEGEGKRKSGKELALSGLEGKESPELMPEEGKQSSGKTPILPEGERRMMSTAAALPGERRGGGMFPEDGESNNGKGAPAGRENGQRFGKDGPETGNAKKGGLKGKAPEAVGKRLEPGKGKRLPGTGNREELSMGEGEKIQLEDVILNDKWEQLKQIYSVVHPYKDERQYIAIQPKDFVIMTGDYQHLANNSFLLHGFYNYRHIVLGRETDNNFYLGVPGVYYEREKMVALMFGFEAFECDGGRAEAGKFGYYLRKVKI